MRSGDGQQGSGRPRRTKIEASIGFFALDARAIAAQTLHSGRGMHQTWSVLSDDGRASSHPTTVRVVRREETATRAFTTQRFGILLLIASLLLAAAADLLQAPIPGTVTVILAVVAGALITSAS